MPPDTQSFQPRLDPDVMVVEDDANVSSGNIEQATDMMEVGNNVGPSRPKKPAESSSRNQDSFPSTSSSSGGERMLKFNIIYCDRVIKLELPESSTVSK